MIWEAYYDRPSIPEIREGSPGRRPQPLALDNIFICDAGGFAAQIADDMGAFGKCYRQQLVEGDLSRVEQSDRFLRELEEQVPVSRTFTNVADVAGSLPIVPAVLAGHPQSMRRRHRVKRPAGPLSIFLETTGSGGIDSESANQRGAAMLALARKLAEYRPVDLWVCVTYGGVGNMNGVLCKVETAPLDLGRAAHMLGSLSATAAIGSRVLDQENRRHPGRNWGRGWSWGEPHLERTWSGEAFKRFLNPSSDMLFVPAAYFDDIWRDPIAWLKEMLVVYGGETIEGYGEADELVARHAASSARFTARRGGQS